MLFIAGTQSALNRRRWKSHMAYLDAISEDSEDDSEDDSEYADDIPAPVVSVEEEDEAFDDIYGDDDIELV